MTHLQIVLYSKEYNNIRCEKSTIYENESVFISVNVIVNEIHAETYV